MRVKNRTVSFLGNMGLLGGSFLLLELLLQSASVFFIEVDRITSSPGMAFLEDDRLGLRGNPDWWNHDARGFRNSSAPSSATVVALGDSHTYGARVKSEESWPIVLSTLLRRDVYNMGLGGYGPSQNFENLSTAISLSPKILIFGLYFGNDFFDDFHFAERNSLLAEYVPHDFTKRIFELESEGTLEQELGFLFRGGQETNSIRKWLSTNSRLYALLRTAQREILPDYENSSALLAHDFDQARENLAEWQLPFVSVYDGPVWKTIFTSAFRLRTLDDADPRIKIGIQISKQMLDRMHLRATEKGAEYVVLMLPTKEYVFWPRVEDPDEHKHLVEMIRHEDRIRSEIESFMRERGIDFIDPVGELRDSEQQPYFPDGDGHPNALGHRIIAEKVFKFITRNEKLQMVSP